MDCIFVGTILRMVTPLLLSVHVFNTIHDCMHCPNRRATEVKVVHEDAKFASSWCVVTTSQLPIGCTPEADRDGNAVTQCMTYEHEDSSSIVAITYERPWNLSHDVT